MYVLSYPEKPEYLLCGIDVAVNIFGMETDGPLRSDTP
jgi:hypothetical protein